MRKRVAVPPDDDTNGTQLNGDASYLGPALVFTLLDFVLSLVLAIEIGRKTLV